LRKEVLASARAAGLQIDFDEGAALENARRRLIVASCINAGGVQADHQPAEPVAADL
jgi:hypothetical protein